MAIVPRAPLEILDFTAAGRAATFAAAIVGIFASSPTFLTPVEAAPNPLGTATEQVGPGFLQANVSVLPHGTSGFQGTIRGLASGLNVANRPRPDWPNPRGAAPLNVVDSTNGFTAPQRGVAHKPFLQAQWPNPAGLQVTQPPRVPQNLQLTTLRVVAPFVQSSWPNPTGLQRVGPAPFPQNLQLTTLGVVVVPANPLGTAVEVGGPPFLVPIAQTWTQNLQQTTLATVTAAAPFKQIDWPNPRAAQQPNVGDVKGFTSPQRGVATKPIHLDEWPVPKGAAPINVGDVEGFPTPLRDYAGGLNTANRPHPDWPNPQSRPPLNTGFTDSLLPLPLAGVAAPFAQKDWPNPRGAVPLNVGDVEGFPLPLRDYAGGLNDANKRKYDWPNPRGPEPARQAETRGFETPLRGFASGLNDGRWRNLDWPNPRGPQRSIDALTWTQSLVLGITAQGTEPFHQDDWPLAVPRVYRQIADSTGFPLPILNFSIGLNDGKWRNLDWPNPRGTAPNQPLGWTQDLQQTPFTTPPVPAPAQRDWPNPGLGKPPLNVGWVQGFAQPILNYAVGLNNGRWRNLDWPVPRGAQRPVDLLTWIGPKTQPAPFAQYDWPVPKGLGPRQADSIGFPEPVRDYAVGLNAANKRPSDWPVPKGPQRSIDALTWTQTLALQLSQAPTKPTAQNDWPLPIQGVYRQIAETRGFETPQRNYASGLNDANKRKYDWPNPTGKPPLNVGWTQDFQQPLRAAQVLRTSLRNYDWPVPKGRPPLNVGWVQGFDASDLTAFRSYANLRNFDWPVPKAAERSIALRTWTVNLLQGTLTPSPFVPVCAHVEVLFPSAEVAVLFGTANLEALAAAASMDVLVSDAETGVLVPEAVTSIDECPGVIPEAEANALLLEDGISSILLEDDTSEVLLE